MKKNAPIKEIVEYGLEQVPSEATVSMKLIDFMYIQNVIFEYIRFFHQPLHYPDIECVKEFLGDINSGGGFEVLNTAYYKKLFKVKLPAEIAEMLEEGAFDHPLFPQYYDKGKE